MGRTVQTITAGGAATDAGLTSAQALALIRANTGYEYIKTVKLNTSEVSAVEITGLDATIYSGFRIVSNRLGYGGSTTQNTWTVRVLTGASTTDSGSNYEYQGIKFSNNQGIFSSGQTGWSTTFGYAGPPAVADFWLDYTISPGSNFDASIWLQVTDSKTGGYWPASGIMTGIHTSTGAMPTGIRLEASQGFRAITDNAYITVMGLRIKA
jgi:hypothetical protein